MTRDLTSSRKQDTTLARAGKGIQRVDRRAAKNPRSKYEFDKIYSTAGGSGMKRLHVRGHDRLFLHVPANKLELWMWMESERLLHPVVREFYAERDVVFEERAHEDGVHATRKNLASSFNAMFWESQSLQLADGRLAVGHSGDFPRRRRMSLRAVLRATEHHAHSRW